MRKASDCRTRQPVRNPYDHLFLFPAILAVGSSEACAREIAHVQCRSIRCGIARGRVYTPAVGPRLRPLLWIILIGFALLAANGFYLSSVTR